MSLIILVYNYQFLTIKIKKELVLKQKLCYYLYVNKYIDIKYY